MSKVIYTYYYSQISIRFLYKHCRIYIKVIIELRSLQDIICQNLMLGRGQQTSPAKYFLCDAFVVLSHTMTFMMFLCSPQGFVLI